MLDSFKDLTQQKHFYLYIYQLDQIDFVDLMNYLSFGGNFKEKLKEEVRTHVKVIHGKHFEPVEGSRKLSLVK